eukprot:COSAG02_NODE_62532_length_265_cov_1.246988_1_plen_69_part_01
MQSFARSMSAVSTLTTFSELTCWWLCGWHLGIGLTGKTGAIFAAKTLEEVDALPSQAKALRYTGTVSAL